MLNYIRVVFAALLVALVVTVKVLLGRNKKLEHEIEIKDKAADIRKEQDRIIEQVEQTEHEEVERLIENNGNTGRADRLNGVLNNRNNS